MKLSKSWSQFKHKSKKLSMSKSVKKAENWMVDSKIPSRLRMSIENYSEEGDIMVVQPPIVVMMAQALTITMIHQAITTTMTHTTTITMIAVITTIVATIPHIRIPLPIMTTHITHTMTTATMLTAITMTIITIMILTIIKIMILTIILIPATIMIQTTMVVIVEMVEVLATVTSLVESKTGSATDVTIITLLLPHKVVIITVVIITVVAIEYSI